MAYMPRIGDLKYTASLQQEVNTPDGSGGSVLAWTTTTTFRAQLVPMFGRERLEAMKLESPVTHKIFCRYRTDVDHAKRLVIESRIFNIRAVLDIDSEKRFLQIDVEEGVAT